MLKTFYHGLIRKYVILMGTLLNDTYITREDANGNVTSTLRVPVTYAPKDKMLARIIQDASLENQSATSIPLPMISFEMGRTYYDEDRKLPTINRTVIRDDENLSKFKYQYNYVPYNFDFKVYIYVKNAEDGTKIVESILPYFTPAWTTTIQLIPEMEETKDIPVVLKNINQEDKYDGDYKERRSIIWTLDFTLKGYLFGPVKKSAIIKFVKVNMRITTVADGRLKTDAIGNTAISEQILVYPGLTANGMPTTNTELTIPYTEIDINDDYGFITEIIDGDDIEQ